MLIFIEKNIKSVTLIELIIAISLLGLVILSTTSVEMFARKQMKATDIQTQLLNEISPAVEHMVKSISQGIGDKNNPALTTPSVNEIDIRQDVNKTPSNYTDDVYRKYLFKPTEHQIWYYPDMTKSYYEVIAKKVNSFSVTVLSGGSDMLAQPNQVAIDIAVLYDTAKPPSSDNPQVGIDTQACAGSMSIS